MTEFSTTLLYHILWFYRGVTFLRFVLLQNSKIETLLDIWRSFRNFKTIFCDLLQKFILNFYSDNEKTQFFQIGYFSSGEKVFLWDFCCAQFRKYELFSTITVKFQSLELEAHPWEQLLRYEKVMSGFNGILWRLRKKFSLGYFSEASRKSVLIWT